jgi:phosphonopyruvate decarboxylase
MIFPRDFYEGLQKTGIDFFTGVPDSLLKDMCAYITDKTAEDKHIIAANEGNAIGIASGYYLATGKPGMVYMQNSGIGNAVNPLVSLADEAVYDIPILLLIGWRGEPDKKDEPQHVKQGEITLGLLEIMGIPYAILSVESDDFNPVLNTVTEHFARKKSPFAVVVKKGVFEKYTPGGEKETNYEMSREDALKIVVKELDGSEIIVSTTGKTSRELFEFREEFNQSHKKDFLTVGSMGHASQIAFGIALAKPERRVICIDGDGAFLMHMGGIPIIADGAVENFKHIVINNGSHESVGGQPTVAFRI